MLIKIDRQEAIEKFPGLPLRHCNPKEGGDKFDAPNVFANYVVSFTSKSYKEHIKLLVTHLVSLANELGCDHFVFPGDNDIAWLRRLNTHEGFQESLQYLADNKISKRFNGALQVYTAAIPTSVKHLAWLVRTNGIVPYIYFIDPRQNITGNICQYGNLHITTKNKTTDQQFKDVIAKSSSAYLMNESCYNKF